MLKEFEPDIQTITLAPADGGVYEITVNDQLVYSKTQTGRHAEPGEVESLVRRLLKRG